MTVRQLTKQLNKIESELRQIRVVLYTQQDQSTKNDKKAIISIWSKARNSLKGKLPQDPVTWQRTVRSEWDNRNEPAA